MIDAVGIWSLSPLLSKPPPVTSTPPLPHPHVPFPPVCKQTHAGDSPTISPDATPWCLLSHFLSFTVTLPRIVVNTRSLHFPLSDFSPSYPEKGQDPEHDLSSRGKGQCPALWAFSWHCPSETSLFSCFALPTPLPGIIVLGQTWQRHSEVA